MGIFKAIGNLLINTSSDKIADYQKKNNRTIAYKKTGAAIRAAKRKGKKIDPKKEYWKTKKYLDKRIDRQNDHRKSFLKDLID